MNTSNLIKQAGFNPSKEQEVAILRQFGIEMASAGYLHSLVSVEMVKWFEANVRQDVSCDLMAEMENARNEYWATDANLRTALADAEADLEILRAERDELRQRMDKLDVITQGAWFYGRMVSLEQLRSVLPMPLAEQD